MRLPLTLSGRETKEGDQLSRVHLEIKIGVGCTPIERPVKKRGWVHVVICARQAVPIRAVPLSSGEPSLSPSPDYSATGSNLGDHRGTVAPHRTVVGGREPSGTLDPDGGHSGDRRRLPAVDQATPTERGTTCRGVAAGVRDCPEPLGAYRTSSTGSPRLMWRKKNGDPFSKET